MIRPKKDGTTRAREDAFLGDLIPQVTEHLAERRSGDFDAVAGQARFETWLAEHTAVPAPRVRVPARRPAGTAWVKRLVIWLSGAREGVLAMANVTEEHWESALTPKEAARMGISKEEAFVLEAQASAALERWVLDHPEVEREIKETVRAHIHLQELERRTREADQARQAAEQHNAMLMTRHDPAGHRVLGFAFGAAVAVLLVVLDAIPLNWTAQAFGLDAGWAWLVTFILVVASAGAMLGFKLTRGHPRRRAVLATVVTAGYLALLGLRTKFMVTVANEPFLVASLQTAMVTATSAGLVLCGAAVLARTRSLSVSRAHSAARRARQAASEARAAQRAAADKLQRHIGGLRQMLLPWALGSAAPAETDRAKWTAALEQAIRQLFPAS